MNAPPFSPGSHDSRPHPAVRAAVALACGLVIGSIAYVHAWKSSRHNYFLFANEYRALDDMQRISSALTKELAEGRAPPADLHELKFPNGDEFKRSATGAPLDPWGHQYSYRATGDAWELLSFGRDGASGGIGLDADIPSEPPRHNVGEATLPQFAFDLQTGGIALTCGLAAIGTTIACWVLMRRASGQSVVVQLTGWGFTLGAAYIVSQIMAVLHVPSGH